MPSSLPRDTKIWDPTEEDEDAGIEPIFDGKTVVLNCTKITFSMKCLLNMKPIPGQDTTNYYQTRLAYGDFLGYDNPIITIKGIIDAEIDTDGTPSDNANPTIEILMRFAKSGRVLKIQDIYDGSDDKYRMHSLNSYGNATDFNVMIESLNFEAVSQSGTREGRKIDYTMVCREVRPEGGS